MTTRAFSHLSSYLPRGALLGTASRVHSRKCRYFTCSKPPSALQSMARPSLRNQSRSFSIFSTSVRHPRLVTALQCGGQHQSTAESSRQLLHTSALPDAIRGPSAAALLQTAPAEEDSAFQKFTRSMLGTLVAATLAFAIFLSTSPTVYAAAFPFGPLVSSSPATLEMKAPEPDKSELSAEELQTVELFLQNTPSVVNIANIASRTDFYTMDTMQVPQGTGSGFIWDMKGHVVTNFHVIRGASDIKVALIDSSVYPAKFIGGDPDKDVAVLQLQAPEEKLAELKPISIGTSTNLQVGQKVYAIGNPFGLDHTLTQGIVSGLGRELATPGYRGVPIKNVIQTDAAINPGNSGGVLLNSRGRLIGINTAIADPTGKGASSGVGFAIPIDTAKGLVEQVLKYGKVVRPVLGITIAPPQTVRQIGVEGVLVLEVPSGGPADRAGIKGTYRDELGRVVLGDVITGIDGKEIKLQRDLFEMLDEKRPGDKISLEVLRNGQKMSVQIELGGRQLSGTE